MNELSWIEIKGSNLLQNVAKFKRIIQPRSCLMAVVKSNAYGHGLVEVAKLLQSNGVAWFGVGNLLEALILRRNGIKGSILVLGYTSPSELREAAENKISLTVCDKAILDGFKSIEGLSIPKIGVHIKIETGLNRQGISPSKCLRYAQAVQRAGGVIEGIYTHFSDPGDEALVRLQLNKFGQAASILKKYGFNIPYLHAAETKSVILYPDCHFDIVRVGGGIYGLKGGDILGLKKVFKWCTRVVRIKSVKKGQSVGYGGTYVLERDSRLALLPVGYADGIDRRLSNIGKVVINNKEAPIRGTVCMSMVIVDITDVPGVKAGDTAVLLGGDVSINEVARDLNTINYEVLSRVNPQIPRVVV